MSGIFFYQLEGGGNWVLDADNVGQTRGGYFVKDLQFTDGIWQLGIVDPKDGSYKQAVQPLTDYKKADGSVYRTPEELQRLCGSFFGSSGGGSMVNLTTPIEFLDSDTNLKLRILVRGSAVCFDKELTPTGFSGAEDTDWKEAGSFGSDV